MCCAAVTAAAKGFDDWDDSDDDDDADDGKEEPESKKEEEESMLATHTHPYIDTHTQTHAYHTSITDIVLPNVCTSANADKQVSTRRVGRLLPGRRAWRTRIAVMRATMGTFGRSPKKTSTRSR